LASGDEDPALRRLRKICQELPEAAIETHGRHAALAVRKRNFGWFTDDHHGDGIVGLIVKVPTGESSGLIASDPARFYLPSYLGPKGWVAVRLDTAEVDWAEVRELLIDSYRLIAPKGLVKRLDSRTEH
jgi:hypothetical protein